MESETNQKDIVKNWKQQRFKDKIDKANSRHPMITLIRSSAENKITKIFQDNYSNIKPISIFDEKNIEPTSKIIPLNL